MACVQPRRGKWVADWRDDNNRRYWKTFDTQEDANIYLGKVTEKLKRGTFQRLAEVPTFAQIARPTGWRTRSRAFGSPRMRSIRSTSKPHLAPAIGKLRVDQIRVKHLEDFRDERQRKGKLKPQT